MSVTIISGQSLTVQYMDYVVWQNHNSAFQIPYGITIGHKGVYLCNTYDNNILLLNQSSGVILATYNTTNPSFILPNTAPISRIGTNDNVLYVADGGNDRIVVLNTATNTISYTLTNVSNTAAAFAVLTVDSNGVLWGTSAGTNNVFKGVSNQNNLLEFVPVDTTLYTPEGIAVDMNGSFYIANLAVAPGVPASIMKFWANGTLVWTVNATMFPGIFTQDNFHPFALAYDSFSNSVWSVANNLVFGVSCVNGAVIGVYTMLNSSLNNPSGIAFSLPDTDVSSFPVLMYVADTGNSRVVVFNLTVFHPYIPPYVPPPPTPLLKIPVWSVVVICIGGCVLLFFLFVLCRWFNGLYTFGLEQWFVPRPPPRATRRSSNRSSHSSSTDTYPRDRGFAAKIFS
jgi:hypothetical protein